MKTLAIGLVLCIAFFIAMIPASTQTVPQGVIRGNVYDAETGSPVEGATVTCRGEANGILQKTTITDSYGYFEFKTLKVDETYGITVEHENYETESKPVFPSHSEPQFSLRFELQPTVTQGAIIGNVYDAETGSPVEGATVTCRGEANGILQKITITDSYGYFEFKTLKVGETYGITVEHENYETESKTVFPSHSEPQISLRFELPITPPKPTTTIPAFQIIPAIMALLAVAYLMRRRK